MTASPRTLLVLVGCAALLAPAGIALKIHLEGTRALAAAEAARAEGRLDRAQLLYLRAGRWWLPGNGVRDAAAAQLLALARDRVAAGDWAGAVSAFDDVRALHYGSAALLPAGGETLDAANREMADALARWRQADTGIPGDPAPLAATYLGQLTTVDRPAPGWTLLMGLALLGWLGTLGVYAWRYDRLRRRWIGPAVAGALFAVWLVALRMMGP